jgi:hypothetical protein
LAIASGVALAVAAVSGAAAFDRSFWHRQAFLGFWEGVDPLDGSVVQSSISDVENDGVIEIYQREGFFTSCYNGTTNTLGRGLFIGTGTVVSKGVLETVLDRICVDDDGTQVPQDPIERRYLLESKGKVLRLEFTHELLLHRISE